MEIHLRGALSPFYNGQINLKVKSPQEALRALILQDPELRDFIETKPLTYRIFIYWDKELEIDTVDALHYPTDRLVIDTQEIIYGESGNPIIQGLLGAALIATAFLVPGGIPIFGSTISSAAFGVAGAALLAGGVAGILAPKPKTPSDPGQDNSVIVDRAAQVVRQGSRVPLIYGEFLAPVDIVLSSGVNEATNIRIEDSPAIYKQRITIPLGYKAVALENYLYEYSDRNFRPLNVDFLSNRDPYTGMVVANKDLGNRFQILVSFSSTPTGLNIASAYAIQKIRVYGAVDRFPNSANRMVVYADSNVLLNANLGQQWNEFDLTGNTNFNTPHYNYIFEFYNENPAVAYISVGELELYGAVGVDENLSNIKG